MPTIIFRKVYRTGEGEQIVMRDACHAEIRIQRPIELREGQYMYLNVPGLGVPSLFQSHPFWIVWWDLDEHDGTMRIDLLIRQQNGFSRRVMSHREIEYSAWLSGPYGRTEKLGDFSTILMLATDIGIAAHLSYLKTLSDKFLRAEMNVCRIVLIWQIRDISMSSVRKPAHTDQL